MRQRAYFVNPFLLIFLVSFLSINKLSAQTASSSDVYLPALSPIVTAASSLSIVTDARSAALGGLGVATEADAVSAYFNPAKLSRTGNSYGVSVAYLSWLSAITDGIGIADLTGYFRPSFLGAERKHTFGVSLRRMNIDDVHVFGKSGSITHTFSPFEASAQLSYAYALSDKWSFGTGLRYFYTAGSSGHLSYYPSVGNFTFDLGALFTDYLDAEKKHKLTAGASLLNIGPKLKIGESSKSLFMPTMLRAGVGYQTRFAKNISLASYLELEKLLVPSYPIGKDSDGTTDLIDEYYSTTALQGIFASFSDAPEGFGEELREYTPALGIEAGYNDLAFLRLGYKYMHPSKGSDSGFSMGVGVKYKFVRFDFAYFAAISARNPQNGTLRLSLTGSF
ncbi:hypothetical protein HQ39_02970 [Porphyromonas sp. COT-108 OH2963]|uniref:type IX secretion system outer membrane channel protein PorV n=1 Tax=Porphyromonas sp. COT-108 OH2963 TaxID=1515614 RepID=UPI00052C3B1E|nr:type IX secretion system outer membrane channel protein PorV [Porphyromonas sp. COT-108 OH2963]KGN96303.1 hypothetical protein HQ39_02970 [Porphyromonas sp. COT-108 OH2963]